MAYYKTGESNSLNLAQVSNCFPSSGGTKRCVLGYTPEPSVPSYTVTGRNNATTLLGGALSIYNSSDDRIIHRITTGSETATAYGSSSVSQTFSGFYSNNTAIYYDVNTSTTNPTIKIAVSSVGSAGTDYDTGNTVYHMAQVSINDGIGEEKTIISDKFNDGFGKTSYTMIKNTTVTLDRVTYTLLDAKDKSASNPNSADFGMTISKDCSWYNKDNQKKAIHSTTGTIRIWFQYRNCGTWYLFEKSNTSWSGNFEVHESSSSYVTIKKVSWDENGYHFEGSKGSAWNYNLKWYAEVETER